MNKTEPKPHEKLTKAGIKKAKAKLKAGLPLPIVMASRWAITPNTSKNAIGEKPETINFEDYPNKRKKNG
jgi:hypothetical protein